MQKGEIQKLIGFLLFIFGMLSLVLMLVGANFSDLTWLDYWGKGIGFVMRLTMIGLGLIISYLAWLGEQSGGKK